MNYVKIMNVEERDVVIALNNISHIVELPLHTNIYMVGHKHPVSTRMHVNELMKLIRNV